jgi:hypothetical protein
MGRVDTVAVRERQALGILPQLIRLRLTADTMQVEETSQVLPAVLPVAAAQAVAAAVVAEVVESNVGRKIVCPGMKTLGTFYLR